MSIIKNILFVGAGNFLGGALRYLVSLGIKHTGGFPWATFTVNVLGSVLIGIGLVAIGYSQTK